MAHLNSPAEGDFGLYVRVDRNPSPPADTVHRPSGRKATCTRPGSGTPAPAFAPPPKPKPSTTPDVSRIPRCLRITRWRLFKIWHHSQTESTAVTTRACLPTSSGGRRAGLRGGGPPRYH